MLTIEKLENGKWIRSTIETLKKNDKFRVFKDGKCLTNSIAGFDHFAIAIEDPVQIEGIWGIMSDLIDPLFIDFDK